MRVLSGPIDGTRHANAYIRQLLAGLDDAVALDGFTWKRALRGGHDVIHLHWVEHMIDNTGTGRRAWPKLAVLAAVVGAAKVRRTKLVWTVHNAAPHERPRLPVRLGLQLWARTTDAAIFLTDAGRSAHRGRRFPTAAVIHHGDYCATVRAAERVGGSTATRPYVVACGQLRAYKGLDRLIEATTAGSGTFDVVIAGPDQDGTQAARLRGLAGGSDRVRVDDRFVPDDELVALLRGSVGAVLPYRRMNNSGALLLALSAGVRALVPDTAPNRELAELVGNEWVVRFDGDLSADALERFATSAVPTGAPDLSAFGWDRVIADHVALYRSLVDA